MNEEEKVTLGGDVFCFTIFLCFTMFICYLKLQDMGGVVDNSRFLIMLYVLDALAIFALCLSGWVNWLAKRKRNAK